MREKTAFVSNNTVLSVGSNFAISAALREIIFFSRKAAKNAKSCSTTVGSLVMFVLFAAVGSVSFVSAQSRQPSTASQAIVIKSKQQVEDITKALEKKPGNTNEDIVPAAGIQTRIAIFHDEKREGDLNEVHDNADDIYYVTGGTATLLLGGTMVDSKEIWPGEWRAKTTTGGKTYTIKKGDLIFVPRGTPHQRTVTDKKFTMILVKIFAQNQPAPTK